jgi:hypothetical protein
MGARPARVPHSPPDLPCDLLGARRGAELAATVTLHCSPAPASGGGFPTVEHRRNRGSQA